MSWHGTKPMLGWTMLSREEVRQVERSLTSGDQDTRDEIGFLLLHQGFADRFFPGTSVLHTRARYALFIPWLYGRAASTRRTGKELKEIIDDLLIELAIRLKRLGNERYDVIGGDVLGRLSSQPPDRVYWTALRTWGILLPSVDSRSQALRRLRAIARASIRDDDGERLDEETTEVFAGLPPPPDGWDDPENPLRFTMPAHERDFLRRKLRQLTRPGENEQSLLARLAEAQDSFDNNTVILPKALDARADASDKKALSVARDAGALAAVGRTIYGALVEQLIADDGGSTEETFREQLKTCFEEYGETAAHCDLDAIDFFLPDIPGHVKTVLRETRAFVRDEKPDAFMRLRECYRKSEVTRKSPRRARLIDTEMGAQRRAEWEPGRHNTSPLHYRWHIVRQVLADLSGSA